MSSSAMLAVDNLTYLCYLSLYPAVSSKQYISRALRTSTPPGSVFAMVMLGSVF